MRPGRCLGELSSFLPSFFVPIHVKTSSPFQGGGSGVHWIGLGPPGCAEGRTIPWESWEWGPAPDSASVLTVSGLFSHCLSLSSPVPEADLIALLCQSLVSGCACGAGIWRGRRRGPAVMVITWRAPPLFGSGPVRRGQYGLRHTLAPKSCGELSLIGHSHQVSPLTLGRAWCVQRS